MNGSERKRSSYQILLDELASQEQIKQRILLEEDSDRQRRVYEKAFELGHKRDAERYARIFGEERRPIPLIIKPFAEEFTCIYCDYYINSQYESRFHCNSCHTLDNYYWKRNPRSRDYPLKRNLITLEEELEGNIRLMTERRGYYIVKELTIERESAIKDELYVEWCVLIDPDHLPGRIGNDRRGKQPVMLQNHEKTQRELAKADPENPECDLPSIVSAYPRKGIWDFKI